MPKHQIIEHHFNMFTWKKWTKEAGTTRNKRMAIAKLADRRRAGEMPMTLSHWTVGDEEVAGQSAFELYERQEPIADSLRERIEDMDDPRQDIND